MARRSLAKDRAKYDRATRKARVAERAFVRDLVRLQRAIVATYHARLDPLVRRLSTDAKKPGTREIDATEKLVKKQISKRVSVAYGKMAEAVDDASESYAKAIGIGSLEYSINVQKQIEKRRDESIKLVEDANRDYAADVRAVFGDPTNTGLRYEELQAKLFERGNVSQSRASLIARDQTTKLLGGLNEARQREAGFTHYRWSTSRDESVRPEHVILDGEVFAWDDPPDEGHPSEAIQCRCSAVPIEGDGK